MEELGRGATCIVTADVVDGRAVARKRLLSADPLAIARFARELEVGRRVSHLTGVVPVLDGGVDFLVMPRLRESLEDRLRRGPLLPAEALRIADRLLPVLQRLHGLGVVHRDIKPSNLLFDDDDDVWLADFGVAHVDGARSLAAIALTHVASSTGFAARSIFCPSVWPSGTALSAALTWFSSQVHRYVVSMSSGSMLQCAATPAKITGHVGSLIACIRVSVSASTAAESSHHRRNE